MCVVTKGERSTNMSFSCHGVSLSSPSVKDILHVGETTYHLSVDGHVNEEPRLRCLAIAWPRILTHRIVHTGSVLFRADFQNQTRHANQPSHVDSGRHSTDYLVMWAPLIVPYTNIGSICKHMHDECLWT